MRRDAWTQRAKAHPAERDIWRRLENGFAAGAMRDGEVVTYGRLLEIAETTVHFQVDTVSLLLAEHRSPLRLTKTGTNRYKVSRRGVRA